jgi:hypothetical protein
MKKLLFLIILLAFLSSIFIVQCNEFPRHIDPELVSVSNPNPVKLIELYSNIFGYVSDGEYDEALNLVDSIDNLVATPAAKTTLRDYNELVRTLIYEISETEFNIETAINELFWLRETTAYNALLKAYPHIALANETTLEIMSKSDELSDLLAMDSASLLNVTKKNEETVDYFDLLIQQVLIEIELIAQKKLEGLSETDISIELADSSRFVGEEIFVSGVLSAGQEFLNDKVVVISIADSLTSAVTNSFGAYNVSITIPYLYKDPIKVEAKYSPNAQDIDLYAPTRNAIFFEPKYFTPNITLTYPPTVFPGKEYEINGIIIAESQRVGNVSIKIEGFNSSITVLSNRAGSFNSRIIIPQGENVGIERLHISSIGSGLFGPTSNTYLINVEKLVTNIVYQLPSLVFSGSEVIISGDVSSSNISISNCQIVIEFDDKIISDVTDGNGKYEFSIPESWFTLSSIKKITLTAFPREPWFESRVVNDSIIVFNLIFTALPIFYVAFAIYRRMQNISPQTVEITEEEPLIEGIVYPKASGLSGIYLRAVMIVSRITGIDIYPSNTIREYLVKVAPLMSRRPYRLFIQITRLFERWFYGRKKDRPPLRTTSTLLKSLEDEEEYS